MVSLEYMEVQLEKVRNDEAKKWLAQESVILGLRDHTTDLQAVISDVLQTLPPCSERIKLQFALNPNLLAQQQNIAEPKEETITVRGTERKLSEFDK